MESLRTVPSATINVMVQKKKTGRQVGVPRPGAARERPGSEELDEWSSFPEIPVPGSRFHN